MNTSQITLWKRLILRFRQPNGKKTNKIDLRDCSFEIPYDSKDQPKEKNVYKIKITEHGWIKSLIIASILAFISDYNHKIKHPLPDKKMDDFFRYLCEIEIEDSIVMDIITFPLLSHSSQLEIIKKYSSK